MKKYRLYIGTVFYIASVAIGVAVKNYLHLSDSTSLFVGSSFFMLFLGCFFVRQQTHASAVMLICLCVSLGFFRLYFFEHFELRPTLDQFVGTEHTLSFKVSDMPHVLGNAASATLVSKEGSRVLLNTTSYDLIAYGDTLEVTGILSKVSEPYFLKDKIIYKINSRNVEILEKRKGNPFVAHLYDLRAFFLKKTYSVFSSPTGELVAGLTVEGSDAISDELKIEFRRTGLSHIVALSGTNVSIVIEAVYIGLRRVRHEIRLSVVCLAVFGFALMTGLGSTVIRASLMALISVSADVVRKKYNPIRGLFVSLLIMSLWNPYTPLYDVSFQLSFAATLSMFAVAPVIEILFIRYLGPKHEMIRQTLVSTLAAEMLVTPLILFYSGTFSVVAPLCNLLIVPLVPIAMLFGALPFVFACMNFALTNLLALIVSLPGYATISYMFFVVHFFSDLPFSAYTLQISILPLLGIYGLIYGLLWYAYKKLDVKLIL